MKNMKKTQLCNYICAFMCLLVLITQFLPFWTCSATCKEHKEVEKVVSIAEYTWLPDHHSPITKDMTAVYKAAYGDDYTRENGKKFTFELNDIITPLVIILIGSIVGAALSIVYSRKALVALIAVVVGGTGVYWYLLCPAMKVGANWQLHLVVMALATLTGLAAVAVNVIDAFKKSK